MAHISIEKRNKSHDHELHMFQGKESFLTSQIEIYVEEAQPKIPDGGWGWMVVFAAFVINTISEGISFSFGVLFIEFLNEFGASKSATSWIGSLFLALPLLAGPLGSTLVDRYGCIWMTIVGSLICTTGFILSVFANSLGMLYLTFGVIGGIGRALTFVTAVVSIAFWFEKKRTIALGLAASGTGVGTILFPPLTTYLLSEYGWRGTMLLLGGCFLQMCVCGALMRDPNWLIEEEREKKSNETNETVSKPTNNGDKKDVTFQLGLDKDIQLPEESRFRSMIDLPTFLKKNEKIPVEVMKQLSEDKVLYKIVAENYPNLLPTENTSGENLSPHSKIPLKTAMKPKKGTDPIIEENEGEVDIHSTNTHPLLSTTQNNQSKTQGVVRNFSHSYLNQIKMKRNHSAHCRQAMLNPEKFKISVSSPDVYRSTVIETDDIETIWYMEFWKGLKNVLNLSLFLELHFFSLSMSTIILFIWFIVPYFYLAEHMTRIGYLEDQASMTLSTIGFTNTLGMVLLGWIGDRLNIAKMYAACLILCGVSIGTMMFFSGHYVMLLINSGLFGLFFASCFSLLPSLVAELVPLDYFSMAYGLVLMCMGVGNLTGPPLAGFLFDLSESWEQSFYQATVWIIISGLLVGVIPFTKNRKMTGTGPILNEQIKT
nr:monocarboxylate transporter 13-like [Leptinotarsa decemlineata]XP_023024054.1 monocarboxylate transporter 13-like [Leptinotarsa decemlineata]